MEKDTLRLIVLDGAKELGEKVNANLQKLRKEKGKNYLIETKASRFSNGEGKVIINESIRQKDVYIIADVGNHSCTYKMYDYVNHYGPDEHFQDIKRTISAIKGHAKSVTVVMPLLYESRQHRRKGRESLDCAMALQELERMGIKTMVTFDVHDPNIQNAIPNMAFENFYPTNTILEEFIQREEMDEDLIVVSPDTGAMDRARYYADVLGVDVGMFYKRRDLTKVVNGKNPIVAHEYMGKDVEGKSIIVVDDMIASGDSILEVAEELKKRKAKKIFLIATFAMFTSGTEKFDKLHQEGVFDKIYSTNLSYVNDNIKEKNWFVPVDCSMILANIINSLNCHESIGKLLDDRKKTVKNLHKQMKEKKSASN